MLLVEICKAASLLALAVLLLLLLLREQRDLMGWVPAAPPHLVLLCYPSSEEEDEDACVVPNPLVAVHLREEEEVRGRRLAARQARVRPHVRVDSLDGLHGAQEVPDAVVGDDAKVRLVAL